MEFVKEWLQGQWSMSELCAVHGISRPTGYALIRRFEQEGFAGLESRSRAPRQHPNQTPEAIVEQILELRRARPRWGPKKLRAHLQRQNGNEHWPALSTIGELLVREGLTVSQRKRHRTPPYQNPFVHIDGPNQTWCMDFKGWFRTRDGERIDPLTLSDAYSRYLLRCQAVSKTDTEQVQSVLEAAFREYGLPVAIRSDNGAPFASSALAGLSRLAVYLLKLGIVPERIQAGHPEQNGRHERLHRTLKAEVATPPAATRAAQQKLFHRFRAEYNEERPHEALGQRTPASCYSASPRLYPHRVPEPEYASAWQVRRVRECGTFRWKDQNVFVTRALSGEDVGLEPIDERYYRVYFAKLPLGRFDTHRRRVEPLNKIVPGQK
jgi:transposase InsO family protein